MAWEKMKVGMTEKGEIKDSKMEREMKQKKLLRKERCGRVWETANGNYINKNKAKN